MTDIHPSMHITKLFEVLFQNLSDTWSEEDLKVPRMFVDHNEVEEAIDELIAIGFQNTVGFNMEQSKQIENIVSFMEMKDLLWVDKLRKYVFDKM